MGLNALGWLISHLLMSLAIGMVMLCTCIAYWSTVGNINMQAQNQPSRNCPIKSLKITQKVNDKLTLLT